MTAPGHDSTAKSPERERQCERCIETFMIGSYDVGRDALSGKCFDSEDGGKQCVRCSNDGMNCQETYASVWEIAKAFYFEAYEDNPRENELNIWRAAYQAGRMLAKTRQEPRLEISAASSTHEITGGVSAEPGRPHNDIPFPDDNNNKVAQLKKLLIMAVDIIYAK